MQVAVLGLSGMGKMVIEKLLAAEHEVVVWGRVKEELESLRTDNAELVVNQKLKIVHSVEELRNILRKPMFLWLSEDIGEPTESLISQVGQLVGAGDVVVDGGNTNYKDTQRHAEDFQKRGFRFLGIGVEGGVHAGENGCALMAGGDPDAYQYVIPVLESLSLPNGSHAYFGAGGAGHFVKMVHSGIEAGMLQVIAEGMSTLKKSDYNVDIIEAANTWQGGGIVSSFLLDMAMDALEKDAGLTQFDGNIKTDLSAKWMADDAKSKGVNTPSIAQSLDFAARSQYDRLTAETFVARLIQAMKKEVEG